jgi:membrane protease YdiL (CAAX protease family)
MDFQKILGTFFLGALIGLIVYRTDSLFSGMLAHFTNNAIAVLVTFLSLKLTNYLSEKGLSANATQTDVSNIFNTFAALPKEQLIAVLFVYGFLLLILGAIFVTLVYAFIRNTDKKRMAQREAGIAISSTPETVERLALKPMLWLIPGIVLIFTVYYLEILKFKGVGSGIPDVVRKFLGS